MIDGNMAALNQHLTESEEYDRHRELLDAEKERDELAERVEVLGAQVKALTAGIEACEKAAIYARDTCGLDQDGCPYVSEEVNLFGVSLANHIATEIAKIKGRYN